MNLARRPLFATTPAPPSLPEAALGAMHSAELEQLLDAMTTRLFREHFLALINGPTAPPPPVPSSPSSNP